MILGVLLAGCTGDGIAVGAAWLVVPPTLVFEDAEIGVPNVFGVPVENSGTAEAEVTVSVLPPFSAPAAVSYVGAGAVTEIALVATPSSYEALVGQATLDAGDDRYPVEILVLVDTDLDDDGHDALAAGGDDCDDVDPERFGGAVELCDGVDQDCDDLVDDLDPLPSWWPDLDGDGFGDGLATPTVGCDRPDGSVDNGADCDDADPAQNPDAAEVWYDAMDQDCDGNDDDQDLDGYPALVTGGSDCQDLDPTVHPGVAELWYDGIDQDCDGNDDDQDLDGAPLAMDCVDTDASIGPLAPELDDGADQDCDGLIDEGLWVHGTLVVTELMLFPSAVLDTLGRFFEVYNPTDGHVELSQVEITVGAQVRTVPAAPTLGPGELAVICSNADPAMNGGLVCAAEVLWVGNSREIVLRGGGVDLDELSWLSWAPAPPGTSLELSSALLDPVSNDAETSWCPAVDIYGLGDRGTPGILIAPCQ